MIFRKQKQGSKSTRFELAEPFTFTHIDGSTVTIPAGYASDFASVPRILWTIIPPHGRSAEASVIHDYLYDNRIGSRLDADLIFFRDIHPVVPRWQSMIMFLSVRLFAQKWWNK